MSEVAAESKPRFGVALFSQSLRVPSCFLRVDHLMMFAPASQVDLAVPLPTLVDGRKNVPCKPAKALSTGRLKAPRGHKTLGVVWKWVVA